MSSNTNSLSATMTIPHEDPLSSSRMLASSTGSLSSSRHQSSQIAKTYRQAAQLFLTRRLPEALSTIEPIVTPSISTEQSNGQANSDYHALAPVATASRNTRIKVWSFYLTLLNSIVELGLEEGKHAFGSTRWRALAAKAREGTVWEDVVRDGYNGREGDVDAEVVSNLATLLLTHSPTQTLNQSRLETYLSASANPTLDISSSHFTSSSHERSSSQTPTPRQPSPARSNTGASTPRDLHTRLKVLELYTLHVLPRNGEWDYAREFISISALLDEERKEAFLHALQQLKEETERDTQREEELKREREREMEARRQEEERRKRQAEEDARRTRDGRDVRNGGGGPARPGSRSGTGSRGNGGGGGGGGSSEASGAHSNGKARASGQQNGVTRGPQSKQPAKKSGSHQSSPTSIYKRASALFLALQASFLEAARNMTGNPMLMLRFLLFLIAFLGIVGRREVRERLKRALAQAWEKVRRTVGMGVKVSYI